ncbi:MAG: hypothetical protein MUP86_03035, partial [Dehalococcoidia bacterium]|nr:hypothetical protein [Dehalococcoidia bacterium]
GYVVAIASASGTSLLSIEGRAGIGAIADLVGTSAISLSGRLAPYAMGWMKGTTLDVTSTEGIARALWSSVAATNNLPGTMGEKLNDAGSASNPWTEVLEGSDTAADFMIQMRLQLDEQYAIQGLDASAPMTVTPTGRVAGPISLALSGDGVTFATVTRQ